MDDKSSGLRDDGDAVKQMFISSPSTYHMQVHFGCSPRRIACIRYVSMVVHVLRLRDGVHRC